MVHTISRLAPAVSGRRRMSFAAQTTLLAGFLLAATPLLAQPTAKTARPDPLDAKASIPALSYTSSFAQYRLLGEVKPTSWREANDTVTRIGGWRVYTREAQQPGPVTDAPPAPPAPAAPTAPAAPAGASGVPSEQPKPAPAGHGGHKTR